jgi:glycosidase
MPWDDSPNAGFSTAEPWIPVHKDYATLNAALQAKDPASVYSYWSAILDLRKQYADLLVYGSFRLVDAENPNVFAFVRSGSATSQEALVVLNFGPHAVSWTLPQKVLSGAGHVILSKLPCADRNQIDRVGLGFTGRV